MTIDWEIEPVPPTPMTPRRPGPITTRRYRRLRVSRRGLLVAGAVGVAVIVGVGGAVAIGSGDDTYHRAVAGSRVGQQDPFDIVRPQNVVHVWSNDLSTDPTELLVNGDDAFVVTPTRVAVFGTDEGRLRWTTDVKNAEPYIAANADTALVAATGGFEALDRRTGLSRWRVGIDDPADLGRTVGIVHASGTEIAVTSTEHGGVVGLDATTGAVRWSVTVDGAPRGRMAVDEASGAVALLTADGEKVALRVLDAATGTVRWSRTLPRDTGVPTFVGDLLLIGSGRGDSGTLQAMSAREGDTRWSLPVDEGFEATKAPAIEGRRAIFVNSLGTVYSVDARSGTLAWTTHLPSPALADSPAIAGGVIVVHDTFAQVHTLDLRTGRILASRGSLGVPVGIGSAPNRIIYAQTQTQYGQVMAYAPAVLARPVGAGAPRK